MKVISSKKKIMDKINRDLTLGNIEAMSKTVK